MNEVDLIALLQLVGGEDRISVPKAARRLRLSQSQLARLLTVAGAAGTLAGLNWIEVCDGEPVRLRLTPVGRARLEALP